jgi:hypothetical protein
MKTSQNRLDNLFNTLLVAATVALFVVAQIDFGSAEPAVAAAPAAAPVELHTVVS